MLLSLQESNRKGDPADHGRAECEQDREVHSCAECPQPKGGRFFSRCGCSHEQLGKPSGGVKGIGSENPVENDAEDPE